MISREDEHRTKEVRQRLKDQTSLYDTFNRIYKEAKPISRILLMVKIVQVVDPLQKRKDKEKEKELNKDTIQNYINELKSILKQLQNQSNVMLIFVGTAYCFLGLENTTEDIMELIKIYKNKTKMVEDVHVITFNEECPCSNFPVFYKYEGEVYDKESQSYKDLSSPEKAWILYDNYFCNLGRNLKNIIRSEADFKSNNSEQAHKGYRCRACRWCWLVYCGSGRRCNSHCPNRYSGRRSSPPMWRSCPRKSARW